MHIYLGFVTVQTKPKTIDDYDSIVCAEISDKDTFPELYAIVTKFMMHGPCGVSNPNSPCGGWQMYQEVSERFHRTNNGV